jgi:hypothetical protein
VTWSLHERLLRIVDRADSKLVAETFVSGEPDSETLRAFRVGADGSFREGTVEKKKNVVTWSWNATGESPEARVRDTLGADGKIHRVLKVKRNGDWKVERVSDGEKQ